MGKSSQMALWIVGDGSLQNFGMGCIGYVASDAIFFPLFTLLEDLGYLPRVAFNLTISLRKLALTANNL